MVQRLALGAVAGLAWAAALRAFMAALVGAGSLYDWAGTFVGIILPGGILGGLLGWAWALTAGVAVARWQRRLLVSSPLVLGVFPMLLPGALETLVTTGIGGAAIAVPPFALIGGYALSGRGPRILRVVCGGVALAVVAGVVVATPLIGGPAVAMDRPRGLSTALLGACLFALLAAASAIPHRIPVR